MAKVSYREWLSNKKSLLLTGTGLRKQGFFTPYKNVESLDAKIPPYAEVEALFNSRCDNFLETLSRFSAFLPRIEERIKAGSIPFEAEGMFPQIDAMAAYCIVREYKPARVLEIGSGASSHVLAAALADNDRGTLTCIDPAPRRSISETGADIVPRMLNNEDAHIVDNFAENDILFIDSSHIMLPGMDVDIQFNRMFPRLPYGTIVHVHDIFLPEHYPSEWHHRNYSEQNALIGWIMSGFFDVFFPSFYVATRMRSELRDQLGDLTPDSPERNSGSIWLRTARRKHRALSLTASISADA
jgi:predicted O-methyltransferase YrrM